MRDLTLSNTSMPLPSVTVAVSIPSGILHSPALTSSSDLLYPLMHPNFISLTFSFQALWLFLLTL